MLKRNLFLFIILLVLGISCLFAQEETPAPQTVEDEFFDAGSAIFDKIYNNDATVTPLIYWEVLVVDGVKIGEQYTALKTEAEKAALQLKTISELSDALYDTDGLDGYFEWGIFDCGAGEYQLEASTLDFDIAFRFFKENNVIQLIEADIYPY